MPYKDKAQALKHAREWRREHPEVSERWRTRHAAQNLRVHRDSDAKHRYGFASHREYIRTRSRPCELCGQRAKKMCIDHDGPAGKFDGTYRGVLCHQCNVRLGWLMRRWTAIERYLSREPKNASKIKGAAGSNGHRASCP